MRRILFLTILAFLAPRPARADFASANSLDSGDSVVIAGDSITETHKWACYFQAYHYLHYPSLNLRVVVTGRGGTSSAGWNFQADYNHGVAGCEYEKQVVGLGDVDVVYLMLGHNDGSNTAAQLTNSQGIVNDWIVGVSGAQPVLLGAHPTWSSTGKAVIGDFNDNYETIGTAGGYAFAKNWDELLSTAQADFALYSSDSANSKWQQYGGTNNVHPGTGAHISMARSSLHLLGADTLVSSSTIAANTNTTTASSQCTISSLSMTANGGTFSRLDTRLPMAIDEQGRANADARYTGFQETYSQTITGLSAGTYIIKCDGTTIGTATHTELAAGFEMARLTAGPVWAQCQDVLNKCRDLQGINRVTLADITGPTTGMGKYRSSQITYYQNGDQRGSTYVTSQTANVTQCNAYVSAVQATATPVTRSYSVLKESGSAPDVSITVPGSDPTVSLGEAITFTAVATDAEDGTISSSVVWTDSIDGALGTGASISPVLSGGFHIVTATITDANSNVATDTINATVQVTGLTTGNLNIGSLSVGP